MAKSLVVRVLCDPTDLSRGLKEATAETEGFGHKFGAVLKAGGLVAAAGIGVAAVAITESVKAAVAGQAAQVALDQALRNTHQSVTAMTPALEKAAEKAREMGFTDVEAETALARLETATKSTAISTKDLGVAMDIARFKHTDLTSASQMLAMAMTGSQRAAKQLGITVSPVTTNLDAFKAAHAKVTTEAERLAEAQAKLQDKLLTGNAVIAAVTDRVHGQAQAYAETAAGGMASFSAQVDFMEQKLGNKLLPTLVNVMNWVNEHWPQIQATFTTVFQAIGRAIDFVKPYFDDVVAYSSKIVARVRADWPQISADVTKAMNTVRDIINAVVTVAEAIWSRFGSTVIAIVQRDFNAVISVVKNVAGVIEGVVQLVADLLHGRWGAAWDDAKKIVTNAISAIKTLLTTEIKDMRDIAEAIGKAIVEGTIAGLEGMASAAEHAVTGFFGSLVQHAKDAVGAKSPSTVMRDQVGVPMGQGVVEGWLLGTVDLPTKMSASLQAAVDAGIKVVQAAQTQFQTAFSGLSSISDQMFGGVTGAQQTPAGKKLAALTSAHDAAATQAQIKAARDALAAAQNTEKFQGFSVTPDMTTADQIALFQKNRQATVDAQKALNDLLYQQKVASLTATAAAEQRQLDATNAVRQIAFDRALTQLEAHLQKVHASTSVAMAAITKLLTSYGVTFAAVGADMGRAWVQGLKDSIAAAAAGAGKLSSTISGAAGGIKVPGRAAGGPVMAGMTYLVGENAPELFTPGASGFISPMRGGGGGVNIYVAGSVIRESELFKLVQKYAVLDLRSGGVGVPGT